MQIKFVELLQQSGNFMRNQSAFSLYAVGILAILQFALLFLAPAPSVTIDPQQMGQQPVELGTVLSGMLPSILLSIVNLFIGILMILNIQSINNGQYQHFFQNTSKAIKAFLPLVLLTFIAVFPLSMGFSFALTSGASILAIPLILTGIYLFIKLSLSTYVYLLEQPKTVIETIKFTLQLSRGKMMPLILFVVLSSFVPNILSSLLAVFGNDVIGVLIKVILGSAITVFITVFSFRFYQLYRQLPANQ